MKQKRRINKANLMTCFRCTTRPGPCTNVGQQYTIWFADDVQNWNEFVGNFIISYITPDARLHHQAVEKLRFPQSTAQFMHFHKAHVQIVIVSPQFLQYMNDNPNIIIGQVLDPSRVVAILCGVTDQDVESLHKANLVSFDLWRKIKVVDADPEFKSDFIRSIQEIHENSSSSEATAQMKAFKLNPCKVREGCSKVTIELLQPISKEDTISVAVQTEYESIPLNSKYCNPYTVKFVIPGRFFGTSQIVFIQVKCGTELLGIRPLKCESKMAELNKLLLSIINPQSFMCETLGVANNRVEDLDLILANTFKKNIIKSGLSLLDFSNDHEKQRVEEELPTLLHFAAKYDLKELCSVILDCPGAGSACRVCNLRGHNPADIAEKEGHMCLAAMLDNFSRLSETAEIYIYMKGMTEDVSNADYENLRTRFGESLEHAAHFNGSGSSAECLANEEIKISSSVENVSGAESTFDIARRSVSQPILMVHEEEAAEAQALTVNLMAQDFQRFFQRNEECSPKSSNLEMYGQSQQELLQLLEDFKQEKYTINEVELLFNNWQLRQQNARSFCEKQDQLKKMQEDYDQIQTRCQESIKKKSALERFRCFLIRNVKKEHNSSPVKASGVNVRDKGQGNGSGSPSLPNEYCCRPESTWSHCSNSSSSSDRSRMSVLSNTTCDSGTLSDVGEEQQHEKHLVNRVHSSPRLLSKPVVSAMMTNQEYMFSSESIPTLPKKIPPQPPAKPQGSKSPKTTASSPPAVIKSRKPMPPPRNRAHDFSSDNDDVPSVPAPLLPDSSYPSASACGIESTSPGTSSPADGYLSMDSPTSGASYRPPRTTFAPVVGELNSFNLTMDSRRRESCGYVDMRLGWKSADPTPVAGSCIHRCNCAKCSNDCVTWVHIDSDRCDSVPDMDAPPPPTLDKPNDGRPPLPLPRCPLRTPSPKFK